MCSRCCFKNDYGIFTVIDGIPVIQENALLTMEFDYILVTTSKYISDVYISVSRLGINKDRIIDAKVMDFPGFNWKRYVSLLKNPVTIFSDDCWGGYVYHDLKLLFCSPTVNLSFRHKQQYIDFVNNYHTILSQKMECVREGNVRNNEYPIGKLTSDCGDVIIQFIHSISFDDAVSEWDRRKNRINSNNVFVKMAMNADTNDCVKLMEEFDRIPYKKICFCSAESVKSYDNVYYTPRYEWFLKKNKKATYSYFDYVRNNRSYLYYDIDIMKLLTGDLDYIRAR